MLPVYYCFIHTVNIVLNHILLDVREVGFVFILLLQVISGFINIKKGEKAYKNFS